MNVKEVLGGAALKGNLDLTSFTGTSTTSSKCWRCNGESARTGSGLAHRKTLSPPRGAGADLSAGGWLDELLINALGVAAQVGVCRAARPEVFTRQPELHVFIAELRSQEVLKGFQHSCKSERRSVSEWELLRRR